MSKKCAVLFFCILLALAICALSLPASAQADDFVPKDKDMTALRVAVYSALASVCIACLALWAFLIKRKTKK